MPDHFQPVAPHDILSVGGFLGQRFDANLAARLKDPLLSEEFIRLHERKRYNDWFWLGEQIGKWLDASAYSALIADDDALLDWVNELVERLAVSQEADGYLGITDRFHRNPVRGMELYEMYYVLLGLLVCHDLLGSEIALNTATRLADYIITTWGVEPDQFPLVGPFPGNGHDGGEGTLILEPIVLIGQRTGEARFLQWAEQTLGMWDAWWERYPAANHTCGYNAMKAFAAGKLDVYELRQNIHAHTYHMTLLGIAALYNATGNSEYQDVVVASVDRLADEWIFLTGGMSSTERYVPRRYYNARNQIEVCPQHTWILLLDQVLRWTGEARYAAEIERDLFNHFLAAQLADGSNWSYFTPFNGRAREPDTPNCCNAAGHRIAGRLPVYLYGLRDNGPAVTMFTTSEAVLRPDGLPAVRLCQTTDFPSDGFVVIAVDPVASAEFSLHIRIPSYADGATVQVGDAPVQAAPAGDFYVLTRTWAPGDTVTVELPLPLKAQANAEVVALTRGPLTYAYFQDAQANPMVFHGRRGRYPEDISLTLDIADPAAACREETASDGLLGPVLSVPATIRAAAPLFSESSANALLDPATVERVVLLPFVNQGAVHGEYRVFMHHASP